MAFRIEKFEGQAFVEVTARAQMNDALPVAVAESKKDPVAVYRVVREGFGPLIYLVNGVRYTADDVVAVLAGRSMAEISDTSDVDNKPPSRGRTRKKPSETKVDEGQPDETKTRQHKAQVIKTFPVEVINVDEAEGIVEAVVNVFGVVDDGLDEIIGGAFDKTLDEQFVKAARVRVLDSHNFRSARSVIGKPLEIRELSRAELKAMAPQVLEKYPDATGGLYTKTQYALTTENASDIFKLIAGGFLGEYSIGFDITEHKFVKRDVDGVERTVRQIRQVRLWEYSPVVWGMNPATATVGVKSDTVSHLPTDDKGYTPDGPQALVGDRMVSRVQTTIMNQIGNLLYDGYIDSEEHTQLTTLANDLVEQLRVGIPEDVANRPIQMYLDYFYWGADGPDEEKRHQLMVAAAMLLAGQAPDTSKATQAGPQHGSHAPTSPDGGAGPQPDAPTVEALLDESKSLLAEMEG